MPVRSKFKPTSAYKETTDQSIIRKYMELFGIDVREARQMYREFILKTQLSNPQLYAI